MSVTELLQAASEQRGAFTAEQARHHALTKAHVDHLVATGVAVRRARGIYVAAGAPTCWEQELWVAHLGAGRASAVSGRAAARGVGLRGFWKPAVEVLLPYGLDSHQSLGRVRRTRWLPPDHIVHVPGLPPLTSIARTIFDLAGDPDRPRTFRVDQWRELHKRHIEKIFNDALRRQDFTMISMMRMLASLGRRGRAGTTIMRELVAEFGKDYVPTATDLEDLWLDVTRSEGIEEPERQVTITGPEGWIGCADFVFRGRIVWEVDGPDHDTPLQKRIDAERDAAMRAAGYDVHRAHWLRLVHDPDSVATEIVKSLAAAA